jgi:hypothetical protein
MLPIGWFHGPDREPFAREGERVQAASGTPFHGIASRGMVELLIQRELAANVWSRNAHRLTSDTEEQRVEESEELAGLRAVARESGALSFAESAACVELYLERHCAAARTAERIEVWNIKEGHTSSVWRVACLDAAGDRLEFVVNVARDRSASAELERSSRRLQQLGESMPGLSLARVEDIQCLPGRSGEGTEPVVVTRNQWVSDSQEIHAVRRQGRIRYLLVERFLTAPDAPARITFVYGRRCTDAECQQIESDIAGFLAQAGTLVSPAPVLEVNDGDLVWNGSRAVVVATS